MAGILTSSTHQEMRFTALIWLGEVCHLAKIMVSNCTFMFILRSMELNFPPEGLTGKRHRNERKLEQEFYKWTPPLLVGFGPTHTAPDGTPMLVKSPWHRPMSTEAYGKWLSLTLVLIGTNSPPPSGSISQASHPMPSQTSLKFPIHFCDPATHLCHLSGYIQPIDSCFFIVL